jgi:O-methyltransferase
VNADSEPAGHLRDLYLDLLVGALTHTIYREIDVAPPPEHGQDAFWEPLLESGEAHFVFNPERARAEGRDWPRYAQTMVGLERLRNVRRCVETALHEGVPGDLIEAGAWRGGVAILMRGLLAAHGVDDRMVYVADSFQGLPLPDSDRYPADEGDRTHELDVLSVPVEEVRDNFRSYGLLDDRVRFVEGWFRESLPPLRGNRWAVVRIDGDMYESTMDSLTNLYDDLSPRGFLIIDDFALTQCREAVEDFRRDRGIDDPIERIDWTGVFWRKRNDFGDTPGQ